MCISIRLLRRRRHCRLLLLFNIRLYMINVHFVLRHTGAFKPKYENYDNEKKRIDSPGI